MALSVLSFFRDVVDKRRDLPRLVTGGAWLFALGSLLPLAWLFSEGGNGAVFRTNVAGRAYTVPFLNYSGAVGMLLLCAEMLAVAGAFILTATPRVPRKLVRVGHGVLIAWSLVWTLGTWRLAIVDPGFWTLQALFLTALSGCTLWRAWRNWTPHASATGRTNKPMHDALFDARFDAAKPPQPKPAEPASSYFADPKPAEPAAAPFDPTASTRQQIREAMQRARSAAIAGGKRAMVGIRAGIEAARNHNGGAKTS